MKKITIGTTDPGYYEGVEHNVLHDVDAEGILIHYTRQVDDVMIQSPDGDILVAWDMDHELEEFDVEKCMLITVRDNLKEIAGIKTSLLAIRSKDADSKLTVYVTAQRN